MQKNSGQSVCGPKNSGSLHISAINSHLIHGASRNDTWTCFVIEFCNGGGWQLHRKCLGEIVSVSLHDFYVTRPWPLHTIWPWGSTGVQRYGCIPRSAANNLGEIPKKLGAPNLLFSRVLGWREGFGTRPSRPC